MTGATTLRLAVALAAALPLASGCTVLAVGGAVVGTAAAVGGAVVSTGAAVVGTTAQVAGKAVVKTVEVVTPGSDEPAPVTAAR